MHFFIVESRTMVAELLSLRLTDIYRESTVHIFKSGQAAIDFFNTTDIKITAGIIISNLFFRDIAGYNLIMQYQHCTKKYGEGKIKTIIISSVEDTDTIKEVLSADVHGFLSKEVSLVDLRNCIDTVLQGSRYLSPAIQQFLSTENDQSTTTNSLSQRETELLKKICMGNTLPEAAGELNISINTAKSYYKNIMKKFRVNRTPEVVVVAIKKGIFIP